jgi:hypothetical protein
LSALLTFKSKADFLRVLPGIVRMIANHKPKKERCVMFGLTKLESTRARVQRLDGGLQDMEQRIYALEENGASAAQVANVQDRVWKHDHRITRLEIVGYVAVVLLLGIVVRVRVLEALKDSAAAV